jgi:hypothetical protein
MRFWVGVASRDHVQSGVSGNFAQVCHGKGGPLRKMKEGDGFVYYSPVTTFGGKDKLQSFTAIGVVRGDRVYQVKMTEDFQPYRCDIDFRPCKEVRMSSLSSVLNLTKAPASSVGAKKPIHWGLAFRRGHLEISYEDFKKIAGAMDVDLDNLLGKISEEIK